MEVALLNNYDKDALNQQFFEHDQKYKSRYSSSNDL